MLSHRRVLRLLSEYHDGELPPALAPLVRVHIDGCSDCASEYRALARTANSLRHLPRLDAPASFGRSIRRRIDEEIYGMVPILRGELLSSLPRPILLPALTVSFTLVLALVATMLLLDPLKDAGASFRAPWHRPSRDLASEMTSPRFRDAAVEHLPFSEVRDGKEGVVFARASIDQDGAVTNLQVIYREGDERMIARTLQAVQNSGFEPARIGNERVPVSFLYLFTTTEVRLRGKRRA